MAIDRGSPAGRGGSAAAAPQMLDRPGAGPIAETQGGWTAWERSGDIRGPVGRAFCLSAQAVGWGSDALRLSLETW